MLSKMQIQATCIGDVYTVDEFITDVNMGGINSNDGYGYFHNGDFETNLNVWNDALTCDDVKDFPYVCWYNK